MRSLRKPPASRARHIWLRELDPSLCTLTLGDWRVVASFGDNDGRTEPSWCETRGRRLAPMFTSPPSVPRPNWCLMLWCREMLVDKVHVHGNRAALLKACRMLRHGYRLSLSAVECKALEHRVLRETLSL